QPSSAATVSKVRHLTMKVIDRITRHSLILPSLTVTLVSLTHAPSILLTVSDALAMPLETASSKPVVELEITSITLAIAIVLLLKIPCLGCPQPDDQSRSSVGTLPPLAASSRMTCLCSQMFISALPSS